VPLFERQNTRALELLTTPDISLVDESRGALLDPRRPCSLGADRAAQRPATRSGFCCPIFWRASFSLPRTDHFCSAHPEIGHTNRTRDLRVRSIHPDPCRCIHFVWSDQVPKQGCGLRGVSLSLTSCLLEGTRTTVARLGIEVFRQKMELIVHKTLPFAWQSLG